MYQKSRRFQTKIITYAVLVIFSLLVIGVFVYSYVSKYQKISWILNHVIHFQ